MDINSCSRKLFFLSKSTNFSLFSSFIVRDLLIILLIVSHNNERISLPRFVCCSNLVLIADLDMHFSNSCSNLLKSARRSLCPEIRTNLKNQFYQTKYYKPLCNPLFNELLKSIFRFNKASRAEIKNIRCSIASFRSHRFNSSHRNSKPRSRCCCFTYIITKDHKV